MDLASMILFNYVMDMRKHFRSKYSMAECLFIAKDMSYVIGIADVTKLLSMLTHEAAANLYKDETPVFKIATRNLEKDPKRLNSVIASKDYQEIENILREAVGSK